MSKQIKILQVLPALNYCGGIESYLMNYYRHIDRSHIQFDFITHTDLDLSYKQEIESLGGHVYSFPVFTLKKLPSILKQIDDFFANYGKEYNAIHCHMANAAFFYFSIAKKYGITTRIIHSHQSSAADKFTHRLRNYPLLYLGNKYATHKAGCSILACKFLFNSDQYTVIHNAIDVDKFSFNPAMRGKLKSELGLNSKVVIGNIGRFCAQKNQLFLLDIFRKIVDCNKDFVLLLIGDGELRKQIEDKVKDLQLSKNVLLLGSRSDVNELYNVMDLFMLPSLYEGLPVVGIECQANGLPLLVADTVTEELKINDNICFFSLKENALHWAEKAIKMADFQNRDSNARENITNKGYNINFEANKLEKYYHQCIENKL